MRRNRFTLDGEKTLIASAPSSAPASSGAAIATSEWARRDDGRGPDAETGDDRRRDAGATAERRHEGARRAAPRVSAREPRGATREGATAASVAGGIEGARGESARRTRAIRNPSHDNWRSPR